MEFHEPDDKQVPSSYGKPKITYIRPKTIIPSIGNSREDTMDIY